MARRAKAASQIRVRGPDGKIKRGFNFAGTPDPDAISPLDAAIAAEEAEQAELAMIAKLPIVVIQAPLRPASLTDCIEAGRLVTLASGLTDLPKPAHILDMPGNWPPKDHAANDNGTRYEFTGAIECPICHDGKLPPSSFCPNCKRSSVDYLILRLEAAPKPRWTKYKPANGLAGGTVKKAGKSQ